MSAKGVGASGIARISQWGILTELWGQKEPLETIESLGAFHPALGNFSIK